jgi:Zn-dependent oligopeptidase
MNSLATKTPFKALDFPHIKVSDFQAGLQQSIKAAKEAIETIKSQVNPTFENTVQALECCSWPVNDVANAFFALHGAESSPEIRHLAKEFSQELSTFSNDILLDQKLFQQIRFCYENQQKNPTTLTAEEKKLLEETFEDFTRNGALLSSNDQDDLRKIDEELSRLTLEFSDHVLSDTNNRYLVMKTREELDGLDPLMIEELKKRATAKKEEGYLVTLDFPTYSMVMKNAHNRELRKKLFILYASKGYKTEHDNQQHILKIVSLREQKSKLLGHHTYAHYVLKKRMAQTPDEVEKFLSTLYQYARPQAEKDLAELKKFAPHELERWDVTYYSEKLKKSLYAIDDETLRPYFPLEKAVKGLFQVAYSLYSLEFIPRSDVPVYHSDVHVYEVRDQKKNEFLGLFYADFFPRANKKSGAWMTALKEQRFEDKTNVRPHISIVCNFTPPQGDRPSLLTLDEVKTLFHEFGHALHGLLSQCQFIKFSGTNVFWDFVELPSQIMENWVTEKECLQLISQHFQTGEALPEHLREKILKSSTFQEGMATLRQLSLASLDLAWHTTPENLIKDVVSFEKEQTKRTQLFPFLEGTSVSTSFSHIFSGGYAAGYYSYKWAEVLDADAFNAFKTVGLFNQEMGQKFRECILEKGGTEHPAILYKRFRGQDPELTPLLQRSGLIPS